MTSGDRLALLVIATSLAFLALFLLGWATGGSEGAVTGVQPPASGDWVISRDTTVLGENIVLRGDIVVQPGCDLNVRNSRITFNCSRPGEFGLLVERGTPVDGRLYMSQSSVWAKNASAGWTFEVLGDANLTDSVRLDGVVDGLLLYGDDVTVSSTVVRATGRQGIYVDACDPVIEDVEVTVENDVAGTWDGRTSRPDPVYGLRMQGTYAISSSPTLRRVVVRVCMKDTWDRSPVSNRAYEYVYAYGLYASNADLGTPEGLDISFDIAVQATARYTGTSFYLENRMTVYGILLTGSTRLDGLSSVVVSNSTYLLDANQVGADNAYVDDYFSFHGLYVSVASTGSLPATISDLTVRGHRMEVRGNNAFQVRLYPQGRGIYYWPSSGAMVQDTQGISGVVLDGLQVGLVLDFTRDRPFVFKACQVLNCIIGSDRSSGYLLRLSSWRMSVDLVDCTVRNNTCPGELIYLYYQYRPLNLEGNTFEDNRFYTMTYVYRNQESASITFVRNLVRNNTATHLWYLYYTYVSVRIDSNELEANRVSSYLLYSYYTYEPVLVTDNSLVDNQVTSWLLYTRYVQDGGHLNLSGNQLVNNTLGGGLYSYYSDGDVIFDGNTLSSNSIAANPVLYSYRQRRGGLTVQWNTLSDNQLSDQALNLYYLGYYGALDFRLRNNTFANNSGGRGMDQGLVYFYYLRQDVRVEDNVFTGNAANCLCWDYPYRNRFDGISVLRNGFWDNEGKGIVMDQVDDWHISVVENEGSGNGDYCLFLEQSSYAYDGPASLVVFDNVFTDNPGGGIYLRVGNWSETSSSYGNPDAPITVKKNKLMGNGPDGWALAIMGFYRRPSMPLNDWSGSSKGQYLELSYDELRRTDMEVSLSNLHLDGGARGVTAYGFGNIDAEFSGCVFINFTTALYARDCTVTAWHCSVPEASGRTDGKGVIYVWNSLEIRVTWANAQGVDSGVPVGGATVALLGANGKYHGALVTDHEGRVGPLVVMPWTSRHGRMDAWSPYTATVMANGTASAHQLHLVGDLVDPNPSLLALVDPYAPQLDIASPRPGETLGTGDVLAEGFLYEKGSGVVRFQGRTDGMAEGLWTGLDPANLWEHEFPGLEEGTHNITVRVADASGNWNSTTVGVRVDLTRPTLQVRLEFLDTTPVPWNETRQGYFVRESRIAVNGTYFDNMAGLEEVAIRLNGVALYIFPSLLGRVYELIDLQDGFNIIIVDATDVAGNRATVELAVTQDGSPPQLYVTGPLQGSTTPDPACTVTGLTEPRTQLAVQVESSAGSRAYSALSDEEGSFAVPVELFEGLQKVLVTAVDSAGNEMGVYRDVFLDTLPPEFVVNSPASHSTLTDQLRVLVVCTVGQGDLDAVTSIGGQEVPNTGIFQRWVVLQEGPNVIEVTAVDPVGNQRTMELLVVRDTTDPTLEVTAPAGEEVLTRSTTVRFEGSVSGADPSGGVFVVHRSVELPASLTSGTWSDGEWSLDLELGPSDLEQQVVVRARDVAGNTVESSYHLVYDSIPPSLAVDALPERTRDAVLRVEGSTDTSIVVVHLDGVGFPVVDGSFSIAWPLNEGENVLMLEVSDAAGNTASDTLVIFYEPRDATAGGGDEADPGDEGALGTAGLFLLIAAATMTVTGIAVHASARRREV